MQIDVSQFRDLFFEEAGERLEELENNVLRLETDASDDTVNAVFRAAHSIKGASGTFGFADIAAFTHVLENVLDRVREGLLPVTKEIVSVALRAVDVLKGLVEAARHGGGPPAGVTSVVTDLEKFLGQEHAATKAVAVASAPSRARIVEVMFQPSADVMRRGIDPLDLVGDLAGLGKIIATKLTYDGMPGIAALDPEVCHLSFTVELETDATESAIADNFMFVIEDSKVIITPRVPITTEVVASEPEAIEGTKARSHEPPVETATVRVPASKLDQLVDLVGELIIAQSMLVEALRQGGVSTESVNDAVQHVDRNTRELQERVMRVRMVPVATVFGRFPRLVRDLAGSCGKKVTLELVGEETELDKSVVERLADPLTHLMRNAIDHGLEGPEERIAAGKDETGTVTLAAYARGGNVFIEITDDGRGLNIDKIRKRAIERGLITASQELTRAELESMIFAPGFSTAETVSAISGRGVGMDVVKRTIEGLGGSISIVSEPGSGTLMRLKLPLTLAMLDGMSLQVGTQVYVLPILSIVESLRPRPEQVKAMLGTGEVLLLRGETLPIVRLHRVFSQTPRTMGVCDSIVVIVENDGRRIALQVDELLGEQQVVVKSLESNFQRIDGIMGATVMGDGRVALIIDVPSIVRVRQSDVLAFTETKRASMHHAEA